MHDGLGRRGEVRGGRVQHAVRHRARRRGGRVHDGRAARVGLSEHLGPRERELGERDRFGDDKRRGGAAREAREGVEQAAERRAALHAPRAAAAAVAVTAREKRAGADAAWVGRQGGPPAVRGRRGGDGARGAVGGLAHVLGPGVRRGARGVLVDEVGVLEVDRARWGLRDVALDEERREEEPEEEDEEDDAEY